MADENKEVGIVGVEINLRTDDGEILKVDMNKEVQTIIYSMLSNFFRDGIPYVTDEK